MLQKTFTNEIERLLGANLQGLESASLRLNKLTFLGDNSKRTQIDQVCTVAQNKKTSNPYTLSGDTTFFMKLGGRLMVNMAGGILENSGLCLHPFFNYPMIPGSALKGIARHSAWLEWKEEKDNSKKVELAKNIYLTFGYPTGDCITKDDGKKNKKNASGNKVMARPDEMDYLDEYLKSKFPGLLGKGSKHENYSGSVSFLPAIPYDKNWKLVPDIVNCHHMDYYNSEEPNAKAYDDENPNPQFFLAVEAGAVFVFSISHIPGRNTIPDFNPLEFAKKHLKKGLEEHGIGAKTSSGYGWFEEDIELTEKLKSEAELARKKQEEQEKEKEEKSKDPVGFAKKEILALDPQGFAEFAKLISQKSEPEQRAFFEVILNEKKEVLKRWKKNKPKNVESIKPVADKLNIII